MITESHLLEQIEILHQKELIRKAFSKYFAKCIKNNHHCARCYFNHNGMCAFVEECFENDQKYYKEDEE